MAENLITGSIQAPGFSGLDIQDASVQLSSGYALEAFNCVIDKYGRIGARKGWTKVNTSAFGAGGAVKTVYEFVKGDGNTLWAAANNKIYGKHPVTSAWVEYPVGGVNYYSGTYAQVGTTVTVTTVENHNLTTGDTVYFKASTGTVAEGFYVVTVSAAKVFTFTATSATTSGSCLGINILTTYTISNDNWQVVSMPYGASSTSNGSGHSIWVQKDHPLLVLHKLGTAAHSHVDGYGFQRLGDIATLPGSYTASTFTPNCALAAYGRLWVADIVNDKQTVYFSDLQNPANFTTGTAGSLDVSTVIPTGDGIVALAAHNGFLIIFCHRNILIYANPKDPSTMTLQDHIKGVGCIARDSVASVYGSDIMFLSETGVQSLGRLIQEKSMPLRDVSRNVRDDLIANVNTEVLADIKAVYYATDAFYLLSLPSTGFTYCFDTRGVLDNGAARTTIWKSINPRSFCVLDNRDLYLGESGYIGKYYGYQDNGSSYRWSYYTNYFDFDQPTTIKMLKKLGLVVIGGGSQVVSIKWGFDYTNNYSSSVIALDPVPVSEYGVGEYGIAEYANGIALDTLKFNASGAGKVLQIGFESDINGSPLSIQKVDIAIKQGKTL